MKKILFILTIAAFIISCGNKKKEQSEATHTHDDGTVHAGETHSPDEESLHQESFEVDSDSLHMEGHQHEDGDEHDHDDDHE
ncbi:MAG: hypothetical protein HQ541_22130 [Mariniphaga sp.]|nr:hypothetical protein [Mariniphaga sp.]